MTKPVDRLEYDERTGKFDDIWLTSSDIHIEALGADDFFIGIYRSDGSQVVLNVSKARVSWAAPAPTSTQ